MSQVLIARARQHCKKIVDSGQKIALVRDIALQLGCDAELVADIQRHYSDKKQLLNQIKERHGL